MATYRADIEYEGTRYHGWQIQANARSVAGELRRALEAAGARIVELGGSGRTDAGVHALAQTAHVRLVDAVDPEPFRRALNDALPPDIHVVGFHRADDRFHARHDAVARSYVYQISQRRTALAKRFVWWIKRPIDPARMASAAEGLAGRHDFARFCERPAEQTGTVVVLDRAEVSCADDLVLVRLVASHFLWKMVRRIVGVLARVGAGEADPRLIPQLLDGDPAAKELPVAAWTAPPSGLFLERVVYPGEEALAPLAPAAAVMTRGPRGPALFLGVPTGAPVRAHAARSHPPGARPAARRRGRS